jgi:integrase
LAALKRMYSLGVQGGDLHTRPYIPSVRVDNARKGFVGDLEVLALREVLPGPLALVLAFAYTIPWRKGEILALTWDRVDLAAGTVRLDTSKNYAGRLVVLPESLRAVLRAQREATLALEATTGRTIPWVFHRNGRPIRSFDGAWRTARRKAGLPHLFFHDLRRSGVRNLIRSGVSETVAMAISGHRTRSVFQRYNITSMDDLRDAARKLDARVTGNVMAGTPEREADGA